MQRILNYSYSAFYQDITALWARRELAGKLIYTALYSLGLLRVLYGYASLFSFGPDKSDVENNMRFMPTFSRIVHAFIDLGNRCNQPLGICTCYLTTRLGQNEIGYLNPRCISMDGLSLSNNTRKKKIVKQSVLNPSVHAKYVTYISISKN